MLLAAGGLPPTSRPLRLAALCCAMLSPLAALAATSSGSAKPAGLVEDASPQPTQEREKSRREKVGNWQLPCSHPGD